MCDDILAALAVGTPLSPVAQAHVAGCARCQALMVAVQAPPRVASAAPAPTVVSPAGLSAVVRRRTLTRVALGSALVAAALGIGLMPAGVPLQAEAPEADAPDLAGLLVLLDDDDPIELPGLEPLAMLHPLPDPLADLPFAATTNPWSSE